MQLLGTVRQPLLMCKSNTICVLAGESLNTRSHARFIHMKIHTTVTITKTNYLLHLLTCGAPFQILSSLKWSYQSIQPVRRIVLENWMADHNMWNVFARLGNRLIFKAEAAAAPPPVKRRRCVEGWVKFSRVCWKRTNTCCYHLLPRPTLPFGRTSRASCTFFFYINKSSHWHQILPLQNDSDNQLTAFWSYLSHHAALHKVTSTCGGQFTSYILYIWLFESLKVYDWYTQPKCVINSLFLFIFLVFIFMLI